MFVYILISLLFSSLLSFRLNSEQSESQERRTKVLLMNSVAKNQQPIQCTTVPRNTSSTSIFINFPQLAVATKTIPGERYMLFEQSIEERGHNMMICRNYEEKMF